MIVIFVFMNSFEADIEQCLSVLRNGGTILYPTDTIWGIGCDATNEVAVEKIIDIKNRPAQKSFVILVADERELSEYIVSLDTAVFNYLDTIAKPTTVIYDHAIGLAENVVAANGSVAIRVCKDEFCKHLIKRFGKPVVSTSANLSGQISPSVFQEIDAKVINGVDYVVKYRQLENTPAHASAIVQWKNGEVMIIRP
jgi:L-threonylcarbamoyladenylate synthase